MKRRVPPPLIPYWPLGSKGRDRPHDELTHGGPTSPAAEHVAALAVVRLVDDRPEPVDPGDPDGDVSRADGERDRYYTGSETWDAT